MECFLDYRGWFLEQLQKFLATRANYQEWKACARMLAIIARRLVYAALREGIADPELLDGIAAAARRAAQEMANAVRGDADVAKYREHIARRENFFRQRSVLAQSCETAVVRYL